jgi:hypothetical protein
VCVICVKKASDTLTLHLIPLISKAIVIVKTSTESYMTTSGSVSYDANNNDGLVGEGGVVERHVAGFCLFFFFFFAWVCPGLTQFSEDMTQII